ncbi:hypothetical protein QTN25_005957 [Entamoeba marina]
MSFFRNQKNFVLEKHKSKDDLRTARRGDLLNEKRQLPPSNHHPSKEQIDSSFSKLPHVSGDAVIPILADIRQAPPRIECVPDLLNILNNSNNEIQISVLWIFINWTTLSSGVSTSLSQHGALPIFLKLLSINGNNPKILESVIWVISNIAGEGGVLKSDCYEMFSIPLTSLLRDSNSVEIYRKTVFCLSNFCRPNPALPFKKILPIVNVLSLILPCGDMQIQTDVIWGISFLFDTEMEEHQKLARTHYRDILHVFSSAKDNTLILACLKYFGALAVADSTSEDSTCLCNDGFIEWASKEGLNHPTPMIQRTTIWVIQNMLACNNRVISRIIHIKNIVINVMTKLLISKDDRLVSEASYLIFNFFETVDEDVVKVYIDVSLTYQAIILLLNRKEERIIGRALVVLVHLLTTRATNGLAINDVLENFEFWDILLKLKVYISKLPEELPLRQLHFFRLYLYSSPYYYLSNKNPNILKLIERTPARQGELDYIMRHPDYFPSLQIIYVLSFFEINKHLYNIKQFPKLRSITLTITKNIDFYLLLKILPSTLNISLVLSHLVINHFPIQLISNYPNVHFYADQCLDLYPFSLYCCPMNIPFNIYLSINNYNHVLNLLRESIPPNLYFHYTTDINNIANNNDNMFNQNHINEVQNTEQLIINLKQHYVINSVTFTDFPPIFTVKLPIVTLIHFQNSLLPMTFDSIHSLHLSNCNSLTIETISSLQELELTRCNRVDATKLTKLQKLNLNSVEQSQIYISNYITSIICSECKSITFKTYSTSNKQRNLFNTFDFAYTKHGSIVMKNMKHKHLDLSDYDYSNLIIDSCSINVIQDNNKRTLKILQVINSTINKINIPGKIVELKHDNSIVNITKIVVGKVLKSNIVGEKKKLLRINTLSLFVSCVFVLLVVVIIYCYTK